MNLPWCLLFMSLILLTSATLGPNDRKKKTKSASASNAPSSSVTADASPVEEETASPDFPKNKWNRAAKVETKQGILKQYQKVCRNCLKRFEGDILGYVTPWHSHGYDIAKQFGNKINLIAPVWLQVKRNGRHKYEFTGTHDIDASWMQSVRKNSSNVKILPRILFEKLRMEDWQALFNEESELQAFVKMAVDKSEELKFDGYVLEIYMQLGGQSKHHCSHLISDLAEGLHQANKLITLVVPPPITKGASKSGVLFDLNDFNSLKDKVDYFSLMTYDYSSHNQIVGPNAPLAWVRSNVEYFFEKGEPDEIEKQYRAKLLLGLNFYGMKYEMEGERLVKQPEAIIGSRFIELIKEAKKLTIKLDEVNQEHVFWLHEGDSSQKTIIFYPTLYSVQQRVELAANLGTGLSIWELGQGLDYFYNLL